MKGDGQLKVQSSQYQRRLTDDTVHYAARKRQRPVEVQDGSILRIVSPNVFR